MGSCGSQGALDIFVLPWNPTSCTNPHFASYLGMNFPFPQMGKSLDLARKSSSRGMPLALPLCFITQTRHLPALDGEDKASVFLARPAGSPGL